jgi:hypothetical protein
MHPFPIRPRAAAGALVLLLVGGLAAWAQAVRTADVTVRGFLSRTSTVARAR